MWQLYQFPLCPFSRKVRLLLGEKGVGYELVRESPWQRRDEFLDMNPAGQTPVMVEPNRALVLIDSMAICEYLEELHPEPALIGATPEARAVVRMLIRRIDSDVVAPMGTAFRSSEGLPMFKDRMRCVPEGADTLKACARDGMARFDAWLAEREWLAGDRFSLADILLFCFLEFGASVGQPMPAELAHLAAWRERVAAHPSAARSANPKDGL